MDRYGNFSDEGEVDHSFFDSDVEEGATKSVGITPGSSKPENEKGQSYLDLNKAEKMQSVVNHQSESELKIDEPSHFLTATRPTSALKPNRSSTQSLRVETTIPTGIPQIRHEFEDDYYPDEEDSSEEESHNSRPKSSKQTNIGKKVQGKASREYVSTISSSDTDYSDTGSDDRVSRLSYQSSKASFRNPSVRPSEMNSSRPSMRGLRDYAEESEDTVTDVTPLSTPDISPIQSFDLAATSEALKSQFKRQENVSQEIYEPDNDLKQNQKVLQDAMDLNQLLKAFMHLDKNEKRNTETEHPVMHNKKNYSFSNDEMRHIEQENQRLLKELSRQATKPRSKSLNPKKAIPASSRLYHSALNRQREQQRIERENMAFLKRLESVKPTVGMTRCEQLMDYQRQAGYLSATALSPRPGKASVSRLSTSASSGGHSRISSASSRSGRTVSSAALLRPTKSSNIRAAWQ
ncbi:hypothetical protein GDO86_000363 [Hymenochirus boettgeri]|uniref:Cilia- and flagella-associated protein 97 n=1 Tax=Hymenochirus boettgeri TaxID=247094 RepID=A0A8T2KBD0_9PIPI|nr:hypothetical protein GDO86_000363 [Hymenochirus boettgeri]